MIGIREFQTIAGVYGLAAAEQAAAGRDPVTGAEPEPVAAGPMVDLRCPESMGKLLGRTRPVLHADGVVELACGNCARRFRRDTTLQVTRVVHRYNLLGELLASEITTAAD